MDKKRKLKIQKCELFMVVCSEGEGVGLIDDTGKPWICGSQSNTGVALFYNKEDAKKFRTKLKRQYNLDWTAVRRCWGMKFA